MADVVGQKLNCRCEDGLDAAMIEVTSEALVGKHCATKNRTLRHLMFASILSSLRLFSSLALLRFAPSHHSHLSQTLGLTSLYCLVPGLLNFPCSHMTLPLTVGSINFASPEVFFLKIGATSESSGAPGSSGG